MGICPIMPNTSVVDRYLNQSGDQNKCQTLYQHYFIKYAVFDMIVISLMIQNELYLPYECH